MNSVSILALFSTGLVMTASAKELRLADCPPAVQQIIQANARAGTIDEIDAITVEGRTLYIAEVDLPRAGNLNIHISDTGALLKTREEMRLEDVPPAVQEAVKRITSAGGQVDDVEKEIANGVDTYEVEIDRPKAADLTVVFAADGNVLRQEEEISD